jgi:hypothetical protein
MTYQKSALRAFSFLTGFLLAAGASTSTLKAQQLHAADDDDRIYSLHRVDAALLPSATEPLSNCGDSLSAALRQGTPEFPCWADIRTVDRWNSASVGYGSANDSGRAMVLPRDVPSSFTFTTGGLSGVSAPGGGEGNVYGGLGAASGLLERRRWQLMAEDAGGLANLQLGGSHLVGMNLSALRATGEVSTRWTWQGSATNTYATDATRQFGPLDYRIVGRSEAPAPDSPTYGLHAGRMTGGEESLKLRYETTRRSAWDFTASHAYTKYDDEGFFGNTERGRAEYLHGFTASNAVGFYTNIEHQTHALNQPHLDGCLLAGGGVRVLSSWSSRASLNISGGVAGGRRSCGQRASFIGNLSLYTRLHRGTDLYVTGGRDLGNGVIEQTVFLNTGGAGVRHAFGKKVDMRVSLNELYGTDPTTKQSYHGSFVDGDIHYRLGLGFSQELAIRHFAVSGLPAEQSRTVGLFTLWWSPRRSPEQTTTRASMH